VKRGDDVTFSYTLRQSARQGEQTLTQGTQQLTFTLWVRHGSRPDSVPVSGAFSDSAAADIPLPVTPTVGDTIQIVGSGTATLTGLDGRSSQLQVWNQGRTRIVDRRGSVLLSVRLRGNARDANGFRVRVSGRTLWVHGGESLEIAGLSAGEVTIAVDDVASHCRAPYPVQVVHVEEGATTPAEIVVECYGDLLYGQWYGPHDDELHYMDAEGRTSVLTPPMEGGQWTPTWAPDGASVLFERVVARDHDLYVVDPAGTLTALATRAGRLETYPQWSPDGAWISYVLFDTGGGFFSSAEIRLVRPNGSEDHSLYGGTGIDLSPVWAPDGSWIAFGCWTPTHGICFVRPDGSELFRAPIDTPSPQHLSWSPDGSKLAFEEMTDRQHVKILEVDGWTATTVVPDVTSFGLSHWSPDGARLAVSTKEDGIFRLRIVGAGGVDTMAEALLSDVRWSDASWSPDGLKIPWADREPREMRLVDVASLESHVVLERSTHVIHARWRPRAAGWRGPPTVSRMPIPQADEALLPDRDARSTSACRPFVTHDERGVPRVSCVP
jgi:hypothetical protein